MDEVLYALADMVLQFGYKTKYRSKMAIMEGGLSALEYAFEILRQNGCKANRNGTIYIDSLISFMDEHKYGN